MATEFDSTTEHPAGQGEVTVKSERDLDVFANHPASVLVEKDHKKASELKAQGNHFFVNKDFPEAVRLYTEAIDWLPLEEEHNYARAVFHANRAACNLQMENYHEVIDDCTIAIEFSSDYIKAYMRRSQAYEALDDLESALKDMNQVVTIDPTFKPGFQNQARLDAAVKKKHEELKEEMIGKLKGLGNTVLGKFGLSLDNFQVNQDPSSGSYSVNFKQ